MNHINKICFAYPTAFREGLSKEETCIPSPLLSGVTIGKMQNLIVNVGLMITLSRRIHINVEVNPFGQDTLVDRAQGDGKFENLKTHILEGGQAVALTSLLLEDVLFEKSGEYEIDVKLFESSDDGKKTDTTIDHYRSYFYVLAQDPE